MFETPCILFAGGKSSRMGEDKSLLPFAGFDTLTEYQYSKLKKIFHHVYISTKDPKKFNFSAKFLKDLKEFHDTYAPAIGFITAFEKLKSEKIFVLSVDTPFVTLDEIQQIFSADSDGFDATVAQTLSSTQALCGIYHRSLLPEFISMQKSQNYKLQSILRKANTHYSFFKDEKAFLNLNHPYEYKEALRMLKS